MPKHHTIVCGCCLAMLLIALVARAEQPRRLPVVETATAAVHTPPDYFAEAPTSNFNAGSPQPAREFRLIQKIGGEATWLAGGAEEGLGITQTELNFMTVIPPVLLSSPLFVTPSFTLTTLDDVEGLELPGELYRASASIMWVKQLSPRWSTMVLVSPGVSSDFEATEGAFRLFGLGAANFQWTPQWQLTLGAVYTGRADWAVFPVAGLTWTPHDDLRVELTAPRPRVAHRIHLFGSTAAVPNDWIYLAGELGGGTWAVERATGENDLLTIRDFRLAIGIERKAPSGLQGSLEVGYVLGRRLEFEYDDGRYTPADTIMLRSAIAF